MEQRTLLIILQNITYSSLHAGIETYTSLRPAHDLEIIHIETILPPKSRTSAEKEQERINDQPRSYFRRSTEIYSIFIVMHIWKF